MARSENTAVNELIARSGGQPRIASTRMPVAKASVPPAAASQDPELMHTTEWMHTTRPAAMPVAAPFEARAPRFSAPQPVGSRATFASSSSSAALGRPTGPDRGDGERFVGTHKMRQSELRVAVGKVVLPVVLLVIAGLGIGGYVVFSSQGVDPGGQILAASAEASGPAPASAQPETAPAAAVDPAPAANVAPVPAATVEPAPVASAAPAPVASAAPAPAANTAPVPAANAENSSAANAEKSSAATPTPSGNAPSAGGSDHPAPEPMARTAPLVDVRIDSTPSGAQVMLVDRGKTQFVGSTPLNTTVDASREYDLVFAYPNKPTRVEHLNARKTRHVAIVLGAHASAAKPADSVRRRASRVRAEPAPVTSVKKPARAEGEPVLGQGTLMISSKPPCGIIIDGKPTGLTTPQSSIPLPAGTHNITLVNGENAIQKTISVQIAPNATEKVIEDLMP